MAKCLARAGRRICSQPFWSGNMSENCDRLMLSMPSSSWIGWWQCSAGTPATLGQGAWETSGVQWCRLGCIENLQCSLGSRPGAHQDPRTHAGECHGAQRPEHSVPLQVPFLVRLWP